MSEFATKALDLLGGWGKYIVAGLANIAFFAGYQKIVMTHANAVKLGAEERTKHAEESAKRQIESANATVVNLQSVLKEKDTLLAAKDKFIEQLQESRKKG